jgi:predicted PolB exonuclease-like 3'-5' exonuclease
MSDLVIDIETVGESWDALDGASREYLTKRAEAKLLRENTEDGDAVAEASGRTALELGLARIVAIGMWNVDTGKGRALVINEYDISDGAVESFRTEDDMLREFWALVGARFRGRIITFNGRSYDGPVLTIRSAQRGITATRDLVGYRYDLAQHCDLADVLRWQGALWGGYNLDYWCRRFGIESPKQGVDGGDVGELFAAGRIAEIAEYVLRDVKATAELYAALKPMLHLFKGGPARPDAQMAIA